MPLSETVLAADIIKEVKNSFGGTVATDAQVSQKFYDALAKAIVNHLKQAVVVGTAGGDAIQGGRIT